MEITPETLYWISRLDGFNALGLAFALIGGIAGGITGLFFLLNKYNSDFGCNEIPILKKLSLSFLSMLILGISILLFVPTTKEMAGIVVIPKIYNSEKVQTIGTELYNLAIDWMKEIHKSK